MGSREKDQTTPHQLSSLVVRPPDSGGGAGSEGANGESADGASSDYEPGEVRRNDPPPYSRSDRFTDSHGYRMRAGSVSPVRRRNEGHRYSPDFGHSGGPPRSRGFSSGIDTGRNRNYSPPYGRGRDGGRFTGRGFDGPGSGPGPFRGGAMPRNNPNVRPREGDWICPDPLCNNLNFARREYCNKCKGSRDAPSGSYRRGHPGPPPPLPRRFPGPPMDRSPGRMMNGHRSPPRGWARDGPRDFRPGGPPYPRHEGRFPDPPIRRDRPDYPEDEYRERGRFNRPMSLDWGHRERGRGAFSEREIYERRPPSPLPPPALPPRGHWDRDIRERSRSPIRGAAPSKDYRRDIYAERGRDNRRGMGRGAY